VTEEGIALLYGDQELRLIRRSRNYGAVSEGPGRFESGIRMVSCLLWSVVHVSFVQ
jgi:hypothetical protein